MEFYRLTIPIPKQSWRWFRFRITTILLLVAIFALALAWRRDHQQLVAEITRLQYPYPHYQAMQATGPPDAGTSSDSSRSWCPATMSAKDWLMLDYEKSVVPTAIVLHENLSPGSVVRITHCPVWGSETTLWQGTYSPTINSSGSIARLPLSNGVSTNRIKVHLDTTSASGWDEIDAVGLVYGNNEVIWANGAKASSTWGEPQVGVQLQSNWIVR